MVYLLVASCVWLAGNEMSTPAIAQTVCNSSLVIGFPNGDNLNRIVGQTVRMSLTITNGPSQNGGVSDNQTFTLADFFPSCLTVAAGGLCTSIDPGAAPGAPPPIQYAGNLSIGTCPSLPSVNAADPFDIKFTFAPAFTFPNGGGCTFSFDVLVTEVGSNGTPANILQAANTTGVCASTLTSGGGGTSAITLTCPPCDDGNACDGVETCNVDTATCVPGTPIVCNDSNQCTDDICIPASGCQFNPKPPSFCDDGNQCTTDACVPATGACTHTPPSPDFCDDDNRCTIDACVPATGACTHTPQAPDFCDDNNVCTDDVCDPEDGCVHRPASPLPEECGASCRMTGGHNFDVVDAEFHENGKVYTTGGQIGAPNESGCCDLPPKGKCENGTCSGGLNGGQACTSNDQCPNDPGRNSHCPWGEWEHNHHSGSDDSGSVSGGSFAFHSGTASTPNESFIKSVLCADPGWCVQARPAPFKQIFWEGTGVFHNAVNGKDKAVPLPVFSACATQPVVWSQNKKTAATIHYYKAHVGDFGEPAGIFQKPADACVWDESCTNPVPGQEPDQEVEINACELEEVCLIDSEFREKETLLHPLCEAQQCAECPDLYEIEIHCTADPSSPVAYRVSHFIREGNFQLHPPVGDSCNPGCDNGVCESGVTGTAETCETCPADCGPCT
jgi:hypothetical protein